MICVWKAEGGNKMHPLTAYAVPSPYKQGESAIRSMFPLTEQGESAMREETSVIIFFALRISGKPTLAHALFLLKEFLNTPQRGEPKYAYDTAY